MAFDEWGLSPGNHSLLAIPRPALKRPIDLINSSAIHGNDGVSSDTPIRSRSALRSCLGEVEVLDRPHPVQRVLHRADFGATTKRPSISRHHWQQVLRVLEELDVCLALRGGALNLPGDLKDLLLGIRNRVGVEWMELAGLILPKRDFKSFSEVAQLLCGCHAKDST